MDLQLTIKGKDMNAAGWTYSHDDDEQQASIWRHEDGRCARSASYADFSWEFNRHYCDEISGLGLLSLPHHWM